METKTYKEIADMLSDAYRGSDLFNLYIWAAINKFDLFVDNGVLYCGRDEHFSLIGLVNEHNPELVVHFLNKPFINDYTGSLSDLSHMIQYEFKSYVMTSTYDPQKRDKPWTTVITNTSLDIEVSIDARTEVLSRAAAIMLLYEAEDNIVCG